MIGLVVICYYMKILHNYWLCSLHCTFYTCDSFILIDWKFVPLNLPHLFLSFMCHPRLWQPLVCSLYLWLCFCLVIFVHLFCFLDSRYKWNHTVFFVLSLTDLLHLVQYSLGTSMLSYKWQAFLFFFFCFVLVCFVFFFFRAAPTAHGGLQPSGPIGTIAAGLHHSHNNSRSESHLRPTPQLMDMPDP